jgi:transposase
LCTNEKAHPKPLLPRPSGDELIGFFTHQTTPENHGYESVFWTTAILAHLITEKYKVAYKSKRPFYLLFEEVQFSFHTPGSVYTKRDEVKVKAWQEALKPMNTEVRRVVLEFEK